jgi:hypothetical protein
VACVVKGDRAIEHWNLPRRNGRQTSQDPKRIRSKTWFMCRKKRKKLTRKSRKSFLTHTHVFQAKFLKNTCEEIVFSPVVTFCRVTKRFVCLLFHAGVLSGLIRRYSDWVWYLLCHLCTAHDMRNSLGPGISFFVQYRDSHNFLPMHQVFASSGNKCTQRQQEAKFHLYSQK